MRVDNCDHCWHYQKRDDCKVGFYYDKNGELKCCKCHKKKREDA